MYLAVDAVPVAGAVLHKFFCHMYLQVVCCTSFEWLCCVMYLFLFFILMYFYGCLERGDSRCTGDKQVRADGDYAVFCWLPVLFARPEDGIALAYGTVVGCFDSA